MKNIKILLLICESRNTAFFRKLTVVFRVEYLYWRNDRIFEQIEEMFAPVSDWSIRFDVW